MHMSEKPPLHTDALDRSPEEVSTRAGRTSLPEGFMRGVDFAITVYERELIRAESRSAGYVRRALQKTRGSIARNLGEHLRCLVSAVLLTQLISSDPVSNDLLHSFNEVFPEVLRAVKGIAQKESLVSDVTKVCEPKGFRVCPYCKKLRVPVATNESHLCPSPASCRKGWHNRQDWLRRKSQHSSNPLKPS